MNQNTLRGLILLVILSLGIAALTSRHTKERGYVERAVRLMDRKGLFAEGEQWEKAKKDALSQKPKSMEEAHETVRKALGVAGGKHSFIKEASSVQYELSSRWDDPQVSFPEEGIILIKLPEFAGSRADGVKYAESTLRQIPEDLDGAVIDLRGNTGGNMYPMIAAVSPFLPVGEQMSFKSRKGRTKVTSDLVRNVSGVKAYGFETQDCPVAVLTDSLTASSGEAVMICFMGKRRYRSFGGPTAGYCSGNVPFRMRDGSSLVLTTGCDVSRDGDIYCDDPIIPDVMTEDPLTEAITWIKRYNSPEGE
ncbi:MAG: S41 family peptidase [Bacteroidales bacterium]|nr:S41 family peptidase [Bacteroidales bacterium]